MKSSTQTYPGSQLISLSGTNSFFLRVAVVLNCQHRATEVQMTANWRSKCARVEARSKKSSLSRSIWRKRWNDLSSYSKLMAWIALKNRVSWFKSSLELLARRLWKLHPRSLSMLSLLNSGIYTIKPKLISTTLRLKRQSKVTMRSA